MMLKDKKLIEDLNWIEKAKRSLSSSPDFKDKCTDLSKRSQESLDSALKDAKRKKEEISDVVLVGGSTRIPKVSEIVKK